jgi:hypothetical protein
MWDAPKLVRTYLLTQRGSRRVLKRFFPRQKAHLNGGFFVARFMPNTKVTFLLPLGYRNTRPRALDLPKYPELGFRDLVGAEADSSDLILLTFSKRPAR